MNLIMPVEHPKTDIEPMDIGIALALGHNGFSNEEIASVLGYVPDLNITLDDLEASAEPISIQLRR